MKPDNTARPTLEAPPGTCDTHMHIYDRRYPKAPTARIDAPDAPVSDYLKVRERLGIERTVVVQPSTYGTLGATNHLAVLEFNRLTGLNLLIVPYRGSAPVPAGRFRMRWEHREPRRCASRSSPPALAAGLPGRSAACIIGFGHAGGAMALAHAGYNEKP
jgi:hypothetical protein